MDNKDIKNNKTKKRLVIIGDPVAQSMSPIMHNSALKQLGLDDEYTYEKLLLEKDELSAYIELIRAGEIEGGNVTIPYKIEIIPLLDELTEEAKLIGAVNTIYKQKKNNKPNIIGHNTDGIGCLRAIQEKGIDVRNKKILILGAGGAARAIAFVLCMNGAKITITNRTESKAKKLSEEINHKLGDKLSEKARYCGMNEVCKITEDSEIIINTTSLGMKGKQGENETPIDTDYINKDIVVMDIVYNPIETPLLKKAMEKGCTTINGIGMLVYQGVEGFKIWTSTTTEKVPVEIMRKAVIDELEKRSNNNINNNEENNGNKNNGVDNNKDDNNNDDDKGNNGDNNSEENNAPPIYNSNEQYELDKIREKINQVDKKLFEAIEERVKLIPLIAEYKKKNNIPRYNEEREKIIISKARERAEKSGIDPKLFEDIMKRLIEESHKIERKIIGK